MCLRVYRCNILVYSKSDISPSVQWRDVDDRTYSRQCGCNALCYQEAALPNSPGQILC